MIEATLQAPLSSRRLLLATFLSLPIYLRPIRASKGEADVGTPIGDVQSFLNSAEQDKIGFFLKNNEALYDVIISSERDIICNCFLDVEDTAAKEFLSHMASARPAFAYACERDESERRNLMTIKLGVNTIHGWVGQDPELYIPGLYWLTLLPAALAERHHVPLAALQHVALEHVELDGGQHLFRFYERPADWRSASLVDELRETLPGVFNIESIRPQLTAAKTFLEFDSLARKWR